MNKSLNFYSQPQSNLGLVAFYLSIFIFAGSSFQEFVRWIICDERCFRSAFEYINEEEFLKIAPKESKFWVPFFLSEQSFFNKLIILAMFVSPLASVVLLWKYSIPEFQGSIDKINTSFFSKFLSCLKDGIPILITGLILSLIIIWLFNLESKIWFVFFTIIVVFSGVKSNQKITRGGVVFQRTWIDAAVITFGQVVFLCSIIVIFIYLWRRFGTLPNLRDR